MGKRFAQRPDSRRQMQGPADIAFSALLSGFGAATAQGAITPARQRFRLRK